MASWRLLIAAPAAVLAVAACSDEGPTDEDLLERFVEDVTGEVDEALVERALAYTAFAELPIDVNAPGHAGVYREERAAELKEAYRRTMRRFLWGSQLKVRSSTIKIDGTHAEVSMRLMTQSGPLRVETGLDKGAAGWKLSKVHLQRGF